ncbi:hypothetical protein K457DRAFT_132007, partial [Linnemannia elongata AG-77]
MAVLQVLVEPKTSENREIKPTTPPAPAANANQQDNRNLVMFSEFSGSLVGFFAFLIFGTTQDAFETLKGIFCCCWRVGGCCGRGGGGGWEEYWRSSGSGGSSRSRDGQDMGDTVYNYKSHETFSQNNIGGNDDNDDGINYSRNYTELYLGSNNNDDLGAYRYPSSDSTQFNNNTFGRQFRVNNNNNNNNNNNTTTSGGHSEGNSNTAFATTTTTADTTTTATSKNTQNNSNGKNRKTTSASRSSSSRRISIVGSLPPPPLKPLPEKPTFQELMLYDYYHTNHNNKSKSYSKSNKSNKSSKRSSNRRGRRSDDDLESGLASDLLQLPPLSPLSLLPPPRAVYSP